MSLSFCSFSSGSSGNCYLVKTEETAVLIDAGISAKRIVKELERTDTPNDGVKALFLTHEHSDHINGARVLLKRIKNAMVYASSGTFEGVKRHYWGNNTSFENEVDEKRCIVISPYEEVKIGDLTISAFRTLHDAEEPYGYRVASNGKRIVLITDTGAMTEEMLDNISDADVLILEANHDTELLRSGNYPIYLKRRILGDFGHLSNKQAADVLLKLFDVYNKKRVIFLAHLSEENNMPAMAEKTILTALSREGYYTGSDFYMGVLLRNEASSLYRL